MPTRYKIHFVYIDSHGKLRSKSHFVKASKPDGAVEKVRKFYGRIRVLKVEKEVKRI